MDVDITVIVEAIITLAVIVASRYLIPFIKSHVDKTHMTTLLTFVDVFVSAAEQIYESNQGQLKKKYVLDKLDDAGYDVDEDEIDAMIEASVLRLHKELSA